MEQPTHVQFRDDGEYVVTEERPDGSVTLVPDTSFEAIHKRLGTEPGTLADFEAEYGSVQPPNGEMAADVKPGPLSGRLSIAAARFGKRSLR